MAARRIVANLSATDPARARGFYAELLYLASVMGHGWLMGQTPRDRDRTAEWNDLQEMAYALPPHPHGTTHLGLSHNAPSVVPRAADLERAPDIQDTPGQRRRASHAGAVAPRAEVAALAHDNPDASGVPRGTARQVLSALFPVHRA